MVTTKDILNGNSSRRGLHEGSSNRGVPGVSKDRRHMIDELNSQRNNSANSGNHIMDGVTSQGSSFINHNHNGGIVLMDATVRNERRVIGSEVPGNIKPNLNGGNIMGTQEKKGIFNNTMGPL
jgi:hypothetical protein